MHRMTVGMVETARRKTRFPTVGTTIHAKAKPPSATTAFCIYFITHHGRNKQWGEHLIATTPRAASPIPAFPKGKEHHHNHLKHSKKELPPLGEGMGRGLLKQQQL